MFYSSPLSNAPLNYTERRQCQTPIAPNLLLHRVKQQPSNLVSLITAHHNCCALSLFLPLRNSDQAFGSQFHCHHVNKINSNDYKIQTEITL